MYANKTTTTLWTETLLEVLYSGLKNKADEATIKAAVADLKEMGFPPAYLVQMVGQEVGRPAAEQLERILRGKRGARPVPVSSVHEPPRAESRGLFASMLERIRRGVGPLASRRDLH
jgi:hypothetical protein